MRRLAVLAMAVLVAAIPVEVGAQSGFPVRDATGRPPGTVPPSVQQPSVPRPPFHGRPGWTGGWRPPVTVIYGAVPDQFIPWPFQFNLPNPPYGMVWMRSNNDAVLFDRVNRTIVQVRSRWFG